MAGSVQSVQQLVLLSANLSFALFRLNFLLLLHARLLADEPSPSIIQFFVIPASRPSCPSLSDVWSSKQSVPSTSRPQGIA